MENLLSIKEASKWVTEHYGKKTVPSQISYLMQYGHLRKIGNNSNTKVPLEDLKKYYNSNVNNLEKKWKKHLGKDLNWKLSFDEYSEKERTKHVHRLHPYKGKFIPQLVEYFLDNHLNDFKKEVFFQPGDIVLDPFCGSGTMLVQANELGINAIGVDISAFNSLISNIKVQKHDIQRLNTEINRITQLLSEFIYDSASVKLEEELLEELNRFNNKYFPSPEFKYKVRNKKINEWQYGKDKEVEFLEIFNLLIDKYKIKLLQDADNKFIEKWYLLPIRKEIDFIKKLIEDIDDEDTRQVIEIILSRTVRSCRATTHSDLATLKKPISQTYYCHKHYKICKPLFSIFSWWQRYSQDAIKRLSEFDYLRTNTYQICLTDDSRTIDLFDSLQKINSVFGKQLQNKKIKGVFSSPPYVGLIDYHEQHAYAYDLFKYKRQDKLEIGPLFKGRGKDARDSYIESISKVLLNCKKYFVDDYHVFLVANDKFNLYPIIAEKAGMKIVNQFKRPVLSRVEKDKSAYSEIIFHMKEKKMAKTDISQSIKEVITTMMDRVMNRVLIEDPFIVEDHRAKKPLYAALVPDEIFKGSHFERRFVTPFGKVWEKLAQVVGEVKYGEAILSKTITGNVYSERLERINEVLRKLEHPEKNNERIKPDWDKEIVYILEGKGQLLPTTVICDLFVEHKTTKKRYSFELKAPLPNSDQTKVSKEKILKLLSMTPSVVEEAFYALPYNPYGERENYSWAFPARWFNMKEDKAVLIGNEFWDFIGGKGTYTKFITVVNHLGEEYRERIYREFLGIEPPENSDDIKL